MAGYKTILFAFLTVGLLASTSRAQLIVPCNYTEVQGPYCHDCQTRAICTPLGGILVFRCWLPNLNHCVNGHCARDPSPQCAPTTTEPALTTAGAPTSTEPAWTTTDEPWTTLEPPTP